MYIYIHTYLCGYRNIIPFVIIFLYSFRIKQNQVFSCILSKKKNGINFWKSISSSSRFNKCQFTIFTIRRPTSFNQTRQC